ncbi:hypothetical protein AFE_1213 [Acidithiobacillus ferrooxidans ATCC 23270]|jgi:hypothetical protein|uniref:Uncharacterized protein n=1 Tax=Acidithiobacillus ferrooxidans (strain ATCC 23270 / DSM 14882 / CIP 104768 / NCIMB 8455) TaxID=243159 RepID=B7J8P6_ACIF2|nr:hypothetical protein AFE_1213 [Acidithiobacillus ferrooxidans ATCC 23270]
MDAQAPVHQCGGRLRSNYENTLAADGVFTGHCRALTVFSEIKNPAKPG